MRSKRSPAPPKSAPALYTASLLRRKNQPARRPRLAYLGYAVAFASAWLDDELVYGRQVGVNHAAGGAPLPDDFIAVPPAADLKEGDPSASTPAAGLTCSSRATRASI